MSLTGCVIGAPPGFSSGDSWTFPLVDPLADGRLVTPVFVNGKGPFLFAIDPDATFTTADQSLAAIADVPAKPGARVTDEHDTTHPTFYAQIPHMKIGDLEISLATIGLIENDHFDADGRRIWGVIGRDVIADSLVFTMDRDRGIATVTVNKKFAVPAGAQVLPYHKLIARRNAPALPGGGGVSDGLLATTRYLVHTDVDGKQVELHVDLGDRPSQLRAEEWNDAKLAAQPFPISLIDEAGTHREVAVDGIAGQVTVPTEGAPLAVPSVGFVPYDDKRWLTEQLDGTLGLDFFEAFKVSVDWDHEKIYLSPRAPLAATAAERISRWGTAITGKCKALGCATAIVVAPQAPPGGAEMGMAGGADGGGAPGAPPPPKSMIHIERDPAVVGQNLELQFAAVSASGAPLPDIYVDLGQNTNSFDSPIDARYAGATLAVVDISPFPRACANHAPTCAHQAPPTAPIAAQTAPGAP